VDAWNRRDLEAAFGLTSPQIEYVNSPVAVEPGTRRGKDEYARVVNAQWEFLGDAILAIQDERTSGNEVLTLLGVRRSLAGSESTVTAQIAVRCTVEDGLVVRQEILRPEDFRAG